MVTCPNQTCPNQTRHHLHWGEKKTHWFLRSLFGIGQKVEPQVLKHRPKWEVLSLTKSPKKTFIRIKLVGGFNPSWKIWKSVGIIVPNVRKNKKCSKPPNRKVTSLVLLVGKKTVIQCNALLTSYNCVCNLLTKWDEPHKYPSYISQFYSKPVVYLYHRERFVSWRNRCRDAQLPDFQRSRCELGVSKAGDTREDLRIRSLAERKFTGDVGCPPSYVCWYIILQNPTSYVCWYIYNYIYIYL